MSAADATAGQALLLDVGSTSVKAALVDRQDGALLAQDSAPMPAPLPGPDTRHELDPSAVLAAVNEVAARLLSAPGVAPRAAIMSTQMHSCLLTDAAGRQVSPVITWQDNRLLEAGADGRRELDRLAGSIEPGLWRRSGMAVRPGFGAGNLGTWLREQGTGEQGLRVHTLGSFLATAWDGPYATGASNAASLGILDVCDVHAGGGYHWSAPLARLHGLDACDLPRVLPEPGPAGTVRIAGRELEWHGDLGDHQASVLGSGGLEPDDLAISLGTAGIAARLADAPSDDPRVDSRPYFGGRYLLAMSRQPGGALAAEFAGMLAEIAGTLGSRHIDIGAVWSTLAETVPPPAADTRLEVTEAANGKRTLALAGIRPSAALTTMYAAFLRHYVEVYRDCVDTLFGPDVPPPARLKFNGGFAARNASFRTALAERLGLRIDDIPDGDLALEGLRSLITTRTPWRQPS
ncbi:FGGY family carbohydrate kinase [Sediminivirga luteola]|uniref:Carbohydrate kinase FGGY N-terminal domain-containing protein n=1 Tax=Sediminivirga luteola TaxID=1774748 RepID=A0A8J2TVU6_9MICO|nr:FGGY family carbohydrate kinase [Sediminivirga luteola]GGA05687.1 hypothetical protein GCM10011333_05670 [Sediminivirga luteola]